MKVWDLYSAYLLWVTHWVQWSWGLLVQVPVWTDFVWCFVAEGAKTSLEYYWGGLEQGSEPQRKTIWMVCFHLWDKNVTRRVCVRYQTPNNTCQSSAQCAYVMIPVCFPLTEHITPLTPHRAPARRANRHTFLCGTLSQYHTTDGSDRNQQGKLYGRFRGKLGTLFSPAGRCKIARRSK